MIRPADLEGVTPAALEAYLRRTGWSREELTGFWRLGDGNHLFANPRNHKQALSVIARAEFRCACRVAADVRGEGERRLSEGERLTVRTAARNRHPLDGADAQALEGALCQVERDLTRLRAENRRLREALDSLYHDAPYGVTTVQCRIEEALGYTPTLKGADDE